jgi:hypothetical protein
VRTSEVVALLDLLSARGTVAWQVAGPTDAGARLIVDTSGVDGVVAMLVARGFAAVDVDLPARVELAHRHHGRVVVLPCAFDAAGDAHWFGPDGEVVVEAAAFDDVQVVPRTVAVDPQVPPVG